MLAELCSWCYLHCIKSSKDLLLNTVLITDIAIVCLASEINSMGDGSEHLALLRPPETDDESSDRASKRQRAENGALDRHSSGIPDLTDAIRAALGPGEPGKDILAHLQAESKKLASKVNRSLNLRDKVDKLQSQVHELESGHVPAGVKLHKLSVDVPEMDTAIPGSIASFNFSVTEGTTFRVLKEKVFYFFISIGKQIDLELLKLQIDGLKGEINETSFVDSICSKSIAKSSDLDELMQRLDLGGMGSRTDELAISKAKAEKLYRDIMQDIAEHRRRERAKQKQKEESLTRTIESLKESKPADLLKATIDKSVSEMLNKQGLLKGSKKNPKGHIPGTTVDLAQAYTHIAAGNEQFIGDAVGWEEPNKTSKGKGKGKGKAKEKGKGKGKSDKVFRGASKPKVKEKGSGKDKEKNKGKSKGKGKGKTKGKGKKKQKGYGKGN